MIYRSLIHLTMVGQYAGQLYCGRSREDVKAFGDDTVHFVTMPPSWDSNPPANMCPNCWAIIEKG